MYIPTYYKLDNNNEIRNFISANSFAILVSQVDGKPWASHIPMLFSRNSQGKEVLFGHVSKANKQWKSFDKNEEVLAIFHGPHAYVSSSWYDHENAPTWNYLAVHVYGKLQQVEGESLLKHMEILVDKYEDKSVNPVSLRTMSPKFVEREMRGVIGFEIQISEIQAAAKLSQNRDETNYKRIVSELDQQDDANAKEIAHLMKKDGFGPKTH